MPKRNVLRMLQKEYNTWLQLCKNKMRLSDPGRKREMFEEDLAKLWDIGASDAVQIIQKNKMLSAEKKIEDIAFYDDQRNARNSVISGKDVMLQKSLQKRRERKARLGISGQSSSDEIDSDVFKQSSSTVSTPSSAAEYEPSEKAGPSSQNFFVTLSVPRNLINSSEITEVLDRFKIFNNAATMLIASFVKACQGDVNGFCISRSCTYRARIANRLQISCEIFHQISETPQDCLALHWDGKLTKDHYGNKHEALSVIISGISDIKDGKLFGVQKLEKATGKAQAQASYELLEVCNLKENVKALVFDTTTSNTGWNQGAAKTLEKLLDHKLFYNACCHHVYELVTEAAYNCLFGDSSGPEDANFISFKSCWPKIDKSRNYRLLNVSSKFLQNRKKKIIYELQEIIKKEQKNHL